MSYHDTYHDACVYAEGLVRYVLEPVLVCRGSTAFLVGTQRQADLLFVEPCAVLQVTRSTAGVN